MTKNILYTFILNKGRLKGHFLHATELVNKVKETLETLKPEIVALELDPRRA